MKTKLFLSTILLTLNVASFAQTPEPHTYDFAVPNNKGDTIWYLITSPQTVAVSFPCDSVRNVIKSDHYLSWSNLPPRNLYKGNIVVPVKVAWQSVEYRVTAVAASTFLNTSVESVSLPIGIDSIGDYNFSECSGLKELSLSDSVCYIGDRCFQYLDLEEVHLGNLVSHLGEYAFMCSGIRRFVCPPLITKLKYICYYCQNLSEVILPEGLDTILYGFDYTPSLKYIHFPNTLKYVYGFIHNSGLREVVFPASVRVVKSFSGCPDLHSVEFLGGTENINAFGGCDTSLLFLDLSPTRMRVWEKSSLYHEKMRGLILPQSLKKINESATEQFDEQGYYEPTNISLVLPENVDSIHFRAWVWIPKQNDRLKGKLVLKPVTPPTLFDNFEKDSTWNKPYSNVQVYVPCGSLEAYKSDPWWHYFYPNIREMDMVEVVLDSLCEYQIQEQYGFMPDQPGVYLMDKAAADSLDCDTLLIYYVRHIPKSKVVDTSVRVYDDGTAFEWTWEGDGEEYDVMREGELIASVKESFYRDTAVETGVQYCYNFIPYLNGCRGESSMTNCYTRVPDSTGVDSTGVDTTGVVAFRKHALTLRPNPVMEALFIMSGDAASEAATIGRYDYMPYEIIDVTGRIVLQGRYNAAEGIRVGGLAKGIYLLRIDGKVGKFSKE